MLFIDFTGYRVQREEQVEAVREHVRSLVEPLGRKVEAVIDYDGCNIDPTIAEAWFDMARDVQARFYDKASRYTTSAFMRLKLGDALQRREMAPHVFESAADRTGPGLPPSDAATREAIWACPWAASIGWHTGNGGHGRQGAR